MELVLVGCLGLFFYLCHLMKELVEYISNWMYHVLSTVDNRVVIVMFEWDADYAAGVAQFKLSLNCCMSGYCLR